MFRSFLVTASTVLAVVSVVQPALAQKPTGWTVRIDRSTNASDPDNTPNLKFAAMGKGFHVTGGPAGTFWNPANTATGDYTLGATFTLLTPSGHNNYYGLILGGADLGGAGQAYVYFVIAQNGSYTIKQRQGDAVTDIKARTMSDAVKKPEGNGSAVNALEIRVAAANIAYVINGTVVHTTPRAGVKTDGIAGFRVNHMLDVQVDGFAVKK